MRTIDDIMAYIKEGKEGQLGVDDWADGYYNACCDIEDFINEEDE